MLPFILAVSILTVFACYIIAILYDHKTGKDIAKLVALVNILSAILLAIVIWG